MRNFALYPVEGGWWSFNDYAAVLDVMARLHPKSVIEFGPGSSTLALIEGGATTIDCCEDDPDWFGVYLDRLERRFPNVVKMHAYAWGVPVDVPSVAGRTYDMALIDGPKGTPNRPAAIEFCLQRARAVLAPTEEWRDGVCRPDKGLRAPIAALAEKYGRKVEIMETGPLSGAFALLT